jgi:RAT1-interacting protein
MTEYVFEIPAPQTFILTENLSIYNEPKQIGFYSVNEQGQLFFNDISSLRYYYEHPDITSMNVYSGFHTFKGDFARVKEPLDRLLKSILLLSEQRQREGPLEDGRLWFEKKGQIITWRGNITKILCIPYGSREEWTLNMIRFRVSRRKKPPTHMFFS